MAGHPEHEPERTPHHSAWRQAAWLLGGFAVLMLILFLAFRWSLHRSVNAELDAIRAAGYPATAAELDEWYEDVPDEENAALVLIDAFGEMRTPTNEERLKNLPLVGDAELPPPTDPLPEEQLSAMENLLEENTEALERLHKGAAMERSRYPVDFGKGFDTLLPHLSELRDAAQLLGVEALWHAKHGRTEEAARSTQSMFGVAASVEEEPSIVSQLVRLGIQALAMDALERVVHRVELDDAALAGLIEELAEAEHAAAMERGVVGNCVTVSSIFTMSMERQAEFLDLSVSGDSPFLHLLIHRISGLAQRDHLIFLGLAQEQVAASKQPTWERVAAFEALDDKAQNLPLHTVLSAPITRYALSSFTHAARIDLRTTARLRAARIALAVERYRLAHGRLPDNLAALTPNFIDTLPPDPFTGQPLKYKKSGDGYTVYSVGLDETDDGGTPPPPDGDPFAPGVDVPFTIER